MQEMRVRRPVIFSECVLMARNVLLTIQIMPESVEVDLKKVEADVKKLKLFGEIKDIKEEPIAFGLKAIKVLTMVPDEGGLTDKIEEAARKIPGVQSAEVIGVTLI